MGKHQKSWSAEQKLEIVNYYLQNGMAKTVREFEVSNVSIYNWEKILVESGSEGFTSKYLKKILKTYATYSNVGGGGGQKGIKVINNIQRGHF